MSILSCSREKTERSQRDDMTLQTRMHYSGGDFRHQGRLARKAETLIRMTWQKKEVSMAGKRCGERFGKDRRNESDLVAAGDNAESWSSVFTAWLVLLIIAMGVGGSMACEADQVKVGTQMNHTCVPCVECPHGMEPSIACGGHGLVLECTPCKPGTFSSAFDKHECRPCTICDDKLVVLQNCTSQSNSKCGGCRRGYYRHNLIPDCLPCSPCCEDGQDVHPPECKTLKGMQCEKRHSDCPPAGFHSPVAPGTTVTPVSPTSTPDTFTTQPRPGELIPLTENHDTKDKATEKSKARAVIISVATVLPVLAVVIVIVFWRKQNLPCVRAQSNDEESGRKSDCTAEKERGAAKSGSTKCNLPLKDLQAKSPSLSIDEGMTLTEFSNKYYLAFERVCEFLDIPIKGCGNYEQVAKHYGVTTQTIQSRFEKHGDGPSKALFAWLGGTSPQLTLGEFLPVLQNINRQDVVNAFDV